MTENQSVPTKKSFLRKKKVWVPIVLVIACGALINVPLPRNVAFLPDTISQGKYMEDFLNDKGNGFHDLLSAARLSSVLMASDDIDESRNLEQQFTNFFEVDVAKDKIDPRFVALMAANQKSFELIKIGIAKPCKVPEITSMQSGLSYLAVFRHLARLEVMKAKIKESQGDISGAYQDYFDTFKIGKASSNGGMLINGLVGIAIDTIAIRAMWPTIKDLDEESLCLLVQELQTAENNSTKFVEVMHVEHRLMQQEMEQFSQRGYAYYILSNSTDKSNLPIIKLPRAIAGNSLWLYFRVNHYENTRTMRDFIVKNEVLSAAPYGSPQEAEIQAYLESNNGPISKNLFLNVLGAPLARGKEAFKRRDTYYRGTCLLAAKVMFENKYGKLSSLDQLVEAGILKSIPIDPFSGEPFKFIDGKIYSIGHDRQDDQAKINVFDKSDGSKNNPMNYGDMVFQTLQ